MRIARCYYNSKFFHVMVQGIRKERIFRQDYLKKKFIEYVKKGSQEYQIPILAYCVMGNHAHILVYTEEIVNLSKMMHYINTAYAHKYNKINKRCGYVFRDRYKSENVMTQSHLRNCIRYIHNNPVKANMCSQSSDYQYSSYNEYLNQTIDSKIQKEYLGEDINFIFDKCNSKEHEGDFLDVDEEMDENPDMTINCAIAKYCRENKISRTDMPREALRDLVKLLVNKYNVSKLDVQRILKISKYMTYKLLEENVQQGQVD